MTGKKLHITGVRGTALDNRDLGKEGMLEAGAGRGTKEQGQLLRPLLASMVYLRDTLFNASSSVTQSKWMVWDPTCTSREEHGDCSRNECWGSEDERKMEKNKREQQKS